VLGILIVCAFASKFAISVKWAFRGIAVLVVIKTVLGAALFIVSVPLLIFSDLFDKNALGVLLSLMGNLMIIH
jgi:hypothetical protein